MKGMHVMENAVKKLIGEYNKHRLLVEKDLTESKSDLVRIRQRRTEDAQYTLRLLIPDLSSKSIVSLKRKVPSFHIPTISSWFGWRKTVDPSVSIDLLRIKLGHHLDELGFDASRLWRSAVDQEGLTTRHVEIQIAEYEKTISTIDNRISQLERLLGDGSQRSNKKLEESIQTELNRGVRYSLEHGRTRREDHVEDGDDLVLTWLWYNTLTSDNGTFSVEVGDNPSTFEPGGGDFGGGGATGSWADNGSIENSPSSIEHHAALGSGSFS